MVDSLFLGLLLDIISGKILLVGKAKVLPWVSEHFDIGLQRHLTARISLILELYVKGVIQNHQAENQK